MSDINDIHKFYELNLPGYTRNDIHRINKFFLAQLELPTKKPLKQFLKYFQNLKEYICFEWLGEDEIIEPEIIETKKKDNEPNDYTIMKYGKHSGEKFKDIPIDYFVWCYKNNRCSKEVKEYVRKKKFVK